MGTRDAALAWSYQDSTDTRSAAWMQAVLDRALAAFRRGVASGNPSLRRQAAEARRWFACRDADDVASFEHICATLGIDAARVRADVRRAELAAYAARVQRGEGSPFLSLSPRRRS